MTQLIIKGNMTQISGETDPEHLLALDKHLSFFVVGAEHTAAFKGYVNRDGNFIKWDGYRKLLNPNMTFSTGLVDRVKEFYEKNNKEITVLDTRPAKSAGIPKDIFNRLKEINKTPYQYQLDVLNVIDKYDRGIIKVATGGGKSLIAALVTAKLGKKTIIYVIGKDLLYQFHKLFEEVFQEKIGLIGDGKCEIANINIASIWTVGQAIGLAKNEILMESEDSEEELEKNKYDEILKLIRETKVHILDECHMSACETIQQIFKNSKSEYFYGLSGSPWRDDGADLLIESILGKYIVNISASHLIKGGFLTQPLIRFRVVPTYPTELSKNYKSVYKYYVVENEERNKLVLEAAKSMVDKGYQTLVLFNNIKHGKLLYDLFEEHMDCALLDGSDSMEERNEVKQNLMNGKLKCIIASRIFDIGIDLPSLSGLVLACGGKSTVRALQRIGRVIRKFPGKKFAAIIDFVDQAPFLENHSKIRYKIYKSEDGFDVQIPSSVKWKKK